MRKAILLLLSIGITSMLLIGCGGNYIDGTYTGIGTGYGGEIEVEVVVEDNKIADIIILSHEESQEISDEAFEVVILAIIDAQHTAVDNVTGATKTTNGIKEAVLRALQSANRS